MKTPSSGRLLRIFVGESDRWHGKPLYEAIVERARETGLAGATVFRAVMGFGKNSRIHTAHILTLSTDLSMVIEIVDTEGKVEAFLPKLDEMVEEGLVTTERVEVICYAAGRTE
jgi:PII-like signaling protein